MGAPHHSPEKKAELFGALSQHSSIRKAAHATGVPVSTAHGWVQDLMPKDVHQLLKGTATAPPETAAAIGAQAGQDVLHPGGGVGSDATMVVDQSQAAPNTGPMEDRDTLRRGNAQQDAEIENALGASVDQGSGAQAVADLAGKPPTDEEGPSIAPTTGAPGFLDAHVDDPLYIQAFSRYVSALANGAHPLAAMHVATAVHPDFDLTEQEQQAVQDATRQLTMSEPGRHALMLQLANPPAYVQRVVTQTSLGDAQQQAIADQIAAAQEEGYLAAINAQLIQLGLPVVSSITDPEVQSAIQAAAQATAAGVVDTWNRDAASAVSMAWLDSQSVTLPPGLYLDNPQGWAGAVGDAREADMQNTVQGWVDGRAGDKATTWASDAANSGYAQGVQDFLTQNGLTPTMSALPDTAVCQDCQDAVDAGDVDQETASQWDFPLHPGCQHVWDPRLSTADVPQGAEDSVWTGQGDTGEAVGMAEEIHALRELRLSRSVPIFPIHLGAAVHDSVETAERPVEVMRRDPEHIHDQNGKVDDQPCIAFDLNGTLTGAEHYPITAGPYPGIKELLDRLSAQGCCIHVTSAGLYVGDQHDLDVQEARIAMCEAWATQYGLPINLWLPKHPATCYVDDRMVPMPESHDMAAVGASIDATLQERFKLGDDGLWHRVENPEVGTKITDWPDPDEVQPDSPRGFSGPRVDIDVHQTTVNATSSTRIGEGMPGAKAAITALYDAGVTVYLSCAGWNPSTKDSQEVVQQRLAGQRQQLPDRRHPLRPAGDQGPLRGLYRRQGRQVHHLGRDAAADRRQAGRGGKAGPGGGSALRCGRCGQGPGRGR